jgi:hypothetical protein
VPQTAPRKNNSTSNFLDKAQLIKLKLKAMRSGVWFRTLQRIDRVLIDLTISITNSIRSTLLAKRILSITGKLEGHIGSKLARATREIGFPQACKISLLAQRWGNKRAQEWAADKWFARYLAMMRINGDSRNV